MIKNIKYNVTLYVNKEEKDEEEVIRLFNQKLLKVIVSLEKNSKYCQE